MDEEDRKLIAAINARNAFLATELAIREERLRELQAEKALLAELEEMLDEELDAKMAMLADLED